MNILGCIDTQSKGDYIFAGTNVRSLSSQHKAYLRNRRIGFVFQSFYLLLGFAALLVIVYGVIPSVITQAELLMEHDAAAELYARTLKSSLSSRALVAVPESTPLRECFSSVRKINPDIVGRIHIESLDLGYLVTQGEDNEYYLGRDYKHKKSTSGTIFLDCRCDAGLDPPRGHYILYGKSMPGGFMFGGLSRFRDEAFSRQNAIHFDMLYADHVWEVFSVYDAKPDCCFCRTSFTGPHDWLDFLISLQQKSIFDTQAQLNVDDVLLTLCAQSDAFEETRLIIHARLVH